MSELDTIFEDFKARYEAGRAANVAAALERAPLEQRQELAEMLDTYLMEAPRRRWDPAAYEDSMAKAAVDRVYESIEGVSGTWPELLPRLRERARIKRADLTRRLAGALGFTAEPEVEKVASYYHEMEHGLLPSEGVSEKVLGALAEIVGSTVEALRASGARRADPAEGDVAFARTAFPNAEFIAESLPAMPSSDATPTESAHDEIDALFLDG